MGQQSMHLGRGGMTDSHSFQLPPLQIAFAMSHEHEILVNPPCMGVQQN